VPKEVTPSTRVLRSHDRWTTFIELWPPRVYTGEDEHLVQTAVEQGIGLLSTVELHRIIVSMS
jgi:hypothetical protein